jgi:hypothetical protein
LISERGAIIETAGGLVQGVWGNGRIDAGILTRVANQPEEVFSSDQLDVNQRGSILQAGFCEDAAVLEAAAALPVRGLILASISAALLPVASAMPFPILITEGFGLLPMNSAAFEVLTTPESVEVVLNAEAFDPVMFRRPEVIIPRPAAGTPPDDRKPLLLAPRQRVRVVRAPYRSRVGELIQLIQGVETLANGVQTMTASVRLENSELVVLPLANLELLE